MQALAKLVTQDWDDFGQQKIALPFFNQFIEIFVSHAKSDNRIEEFGSDLLLALCGVGALQYVVYSGDAFTIFKKLFSHKIISVAKNSKIHEAIEKAKNRGRWKMYEMLNLAQLGDSVKGSVIAERDRWAALKSTGASFMEVNACLEKDSLGFKMMEAISSSLEGCFDKRWSLSEDLLFFTWRWTYLMHDDRPLTSSFWKCIEKNLREVLRIPVNPLEFKWFTDNVLGSAVSYFFSTLPVCNTRNEQRVNRFGRSRTGKEEIGLYYFINCSTFAGMPSNRTAIIRWNKSQNSKKKTQKAGIC